MPPPHRRESHLRVLAASVRAAEAGRSAALVTVVGVRGSAPRHGGARMLVFDDHAIIGTIGGGKFEYRAIDQALAALADGRPRRYCVHLTRDLGMCCGGEMDVFIEPLSRREHLVVYGAGHVGAATARLAVAMGFAVTMVDDRDELLLSADLPAEVSRREADGRRILDDLPSGPLAYHLVVSHDHALDQDLVERLLPRPLAWLGMIGSRAKVARFLVRLRAAGVPEDLFTRLCAPVGLDLGAETPEEIAVSIAAELVRVRHHADRSPMPLSSVPLPARGGDGRARPAAWPAPQGGPATTTATANSKTLRGS